MGNSVYHLSLFLFVYFYLSRQYFNNNICKYFFAIRIYSKTMQPLYIYIYIYLLLKCSREKILVYI
ncbi:hypothetical protein F4703DRAFT_1835597 [Phycomyces blakesleeanus]